MTPSHSDTIRTRLAFAYEAAETEEDRAWVNEGQEALAMMEREVERLRGALGPFAKLAAKAPIMSGRGDNTRPRNPDDGERFDWAFDITWGMIRCARQALAQPGDAA